MDSSFLTPIKTPLSTAPNDLEDHLTKENVSNALKEYVVGRKARVIQESSKILLDLMKTRVFLSSSVKLTDQDAGRTIVDGLKGVFAMGQENTYLEAILRTNFNLTEMVDESFLTRARLEAMLSDLTSKEGEAARPPVYEEFQAKVRVAYHHQLSDAKKRLRTLEQVYERLRTMHNEKPPASMTDPGSPNPVLTTAVNPIQLPPSPSQTLNSNLQQARGDTNNPPPPAPTRQGGRRTAASKAATTTTLSADSTLAASRTPPNNTTVSVGGGGGGPAAETAGFGDEARSGDLTAILDAVHRLRTHSGGTRLTSDGPDHTSLDLHSKKAEIEELKAHILELTEEMQHEADALFTEASTAFTQATSLRHQIAQQKSEVSRKIEQTNALQALTEHYRHSLTFLADRIKQQTSSYPTLRELLNTQVIIPLTGEVINEPYQSGHLPGMFAHLVKEYFVPSVVAFFKEFRSTSAGLRMSTLNLQEGINLADKVLATWDKLQYWSYLTRDLYMTMILINSIPDKLRHVRSDAMHHILTHMSDMVVAKQKEHGAKPRALLGHGRSATTDRQSTNNSHVFTENTSLVLFQELKDYLRLVIESKSIGEDDGGNKPSNTMPAPQGGGKGGGANAPQYRQSQPPPGTHVTVHATTLEGTPQPPAPRGREDLQYVSPHLRKQSIHGQTTLKHPGTGTIVPYIAVLKACMYCTDTDRTKHHSPPCSTQMCTTCGLIGHTSDICCQANPDGFRAECQRRRDLKKHGKSRHN